MINSKKIINFGSLNIDHVYHVAHFVRPGETIGSQSYHRFVGGKGCNQSIALARATACVYHVGCLGEDGAFLKNFLTENKVHTDFIQTIKQPSGHAFIQINPDGQNAIILYPGANHALSMSLIEHALESAQAGDIVLLQNETNATEDIIRLAQNKNLTLAFNPAPATPAIVDYPLELVDILILNETEGFTLTGKTSYDDIMDFFIQKYPEMTVVLTLGANGVIASQHNKRYSFPAQPVSNVLDTTAAGDTFIGYFLALLAQDCPLDECLTIANKAAAITVTRHGAAESIPFIKEIIGELSCQNN